MENTPFSRAMKVFEVEELSFPSVPADAVAKIQFATQVVLKLYQVEPSAATVEQVKKALNIAKREEIWDGPQDEVGERAESFLKKFKEYQAEQAEARENRTKMDPDELFSGELSKNR